MPVSILSEDEIIPETGVKHDQGKARISLLPGLAIAEVMKVGEFGARKYDPHNYRKGMPVTKYIDAAYRHIFCEWLFAGIEYDSCPEKSNPQLCPTDEQGRCKNHSGLHHLAHGAWNILSALEQMMTKPKLDDRWKYPKD